MIKRFVPHFVTRQWVKYLLVTLIKFGVSVAILLIALAHTLSLINVDVYVLVLIGFVLLIWLTPTMPRFFKSFKLPGGWEIEFQELQQLGKEAADAGLLAPADKQGDVLPLPVTSTDANLVLAGLRIEIEKRVRKLAEIEGITSRYLKSIMIALMKSHLLSGGEYLVLKNLIDTLNQAVHGAEVSPRAAEWAMTTGPEILAALDNKITHHDGGTTTTPQNLDGNDLDEF